MFSAYGEVFEVSERTSTESSDIEKSSHQSNNTPSVELRKLVIGEYILIPHGELTISIDDSRRPGSECTKMGGIDLSGRSMTDFTGRTIWRLADILCPGDDGMPLGFPINFIATPEIAKPAYITVKLAGIQKSSNDVIVEVFTWDNEGNPAPSIPFYWRCRVMVSNASP